MQALILAAGMGKRLKELTRNNTKCMVRVNGVTLIERLLRQLDAQSLDRIVIVVGYERAGLMDFIGALDIKTPISYIENPIYDRTNNIYSLYLAKDVLCAEDTLLFESDIIFEDSILEELIRDPRETLALVDRYESWMDGTCALLREDDSIEKIVAGKHFDYRDRDRYFKTVNIYKFSRAFSRSRYVPFLEAYSKALGNNEYYEQVLRVITVLDDSEIRAKRLSGQKWYEIDDIQDLDIAESLFAPDEERTARLQSRYGGYWRYPKLLDFCYLVNPYFPPAKLEEELQASFHALLTQYPSGMRVNTLLAAKNFGIAQERILTGNGAAELIHALMDRVKGSFGLVRPTFEEYPNRLRAEGSAIVFSPQAPDFRYSVEDLIAYFGDHPVRSLVLINPDNPSGNYLSTGEVRRLVAWTKERGIRLIYDESFSDFAKGEDRTLLDDAYLRENPHLVVVKSLSKCYGVPGLRLGILASGDEEMIAECKRDVSIWNINSFAEFFLQILGKYQKDYEESTRKLVAERERFAGALGALPGLRVFPSEANFLMAELSGRYSAKDLTVRLAAKYDILVKDLSAKIPGRQCLRIAVRSEADNDRLLAALGGLL